MPSQRPGNQQREPICHETRMPQFAGKRAWPGCSWRNTLPEITLVDRLAAVGALIGRRAADSLAHDAGG
jgi:hypothetical protein